MPEAEINAMNGSDESNGAIDDSASDTSSSAGGADGQVSSGSSSSAYFKKYKEDELPWNLKVALHHPTVEGVIIYAGGDMPHCVKKNRNSLRNSGIEGHDRELILHGKPMSLKMLQDIWEFTPDVKDESAIMIFRKLKKEIFDLNASSLLRTPHAMKIFSQTMLSCIKYYQSKNVKAAGDTYDSLIEYITVMDRFIDICNGTREKGCELIDSVSHKHVFELFDVVKFHHQWRNEAGLKAHNLLPLSTFQDTVWTAVGIIGAAKQIRGDHNMVQLRGGSDICEESFCYKRDKNANADHLNTNFIMARNSSSGLNNLAAS